MAAAACAHLGQMSRPGVVVESVASHHVRESLLRRTGAQSLTPVFGFVTPSRVSVM